MWMMGVMVCAAGVVLGAGTADFAARAETLPDLPEPGYPRFATLPDGTLFLASGQSVRLSRDRGMSWTRREVQQAVARTAVSPTGETHALVRENWQPFVAPDGTVFLAYRSRTRGYVKRSGKPFYTSIRVITSRDGGAHFEDEEILAEGVAADFHGFWEPYLIQIDERTVALYYSDDLNVERIPYQQKIQYVTYDLPTRRWDKRVRTALDGVPRNSRDGMPSVCPLQGGGFAMVVEIQDWVKRNMPSGEKRNCVFVVGISRSADGRTWSVPLPIWAPADLAAGHRCAAPFIAALPDGRVVISCMADEGYTGEKGRDETTNCRFAAIVSTAPLTLQSPLTPTAGGPAAGFAALPALFPSEPCSYQIWNTVYCDGKDLYFAGDYGLNMAGSGRRNRTLKLVRCPVAEGDRPGGTVQNLLPNGDFEEGEPVPLHWERANGLTTFFARAEGHGRVVRMDTSVERKQAMAWDQAFKADPSLPVPSRVPISAAGYDSIGGNEGVMLDSELIDCEPGQNYKLTADIRGAGKPFVWIKGFMAHPRRGVLVDAYQTRLEPLSVSPERWTTCSIGFNPTARSPQVTRMKVRLYAYWPNGIYEFDNIRVEKISQAEMDELVKRRGQVAPEQ
ncbi:MAG: hypothetical protein J6334_10820 [Kiritimatiellae bacterium]|nr:hypothetical protein [Kiritimatiellia bacterium]